MLATVMCPTSSPSKQKKSCGAELLPLEVTCLLLIGYQEIPWYLSSCLNVMSAQKPQEFVVFVLFLKLSVAFYRAVNCTYMLHEHCCTWFIWVSHFNNSCLFLISTLPYNYCSFFLFPSLNPLFSTFINKTLKEK